MFHIIVLKLLLLDKFIHREYLLRVLSKTKQQHFPSVINSQEPVFTTNFHRRIPVTALNHRFQLLIVNIKHLFSGTMGVLPFGIDPKSKLNAHNFIRYKDKHILKLLSTLFHFNLHLFSSKWKLSNQFESAEPDRDI